jgi:hypothetical protein
MRKNFNFVLLSWLLALGSFIQLQRYDTNFKYIPIEKEKIRKKEEG